MDYGRYRQSTETDGIGSVDGEGAAVDDLEARAPNDILAAGAKAASFTTADPDFTGHGLCSDSSYIQGLDASAPFHPTAAGELAIALVDVEAIADTPGG